MTKQELIWVKSIAPNLDVIIQKLEELENEAKYPIHHISGAFAVATVYNYDEEGIDVELKWGIESDCENVVHTESHHLTLLGGNGLIEWKN